MIENFGSKQRFFLVAAHGESDQFPAFLLQVIFSTSHQKERFRNRPGRSTSVAGSASTSAACQQGVCVMSAWPQTLLITD